MADYVRRAVAGDVEAITALASDRPRRYARYQPAFWRSAANAEEVHRSYLADLVRNDDVLTLVSDHDGTVVGFLIAAFGDAPAVYDLGGRTCTIDDFVVAPGRWLTTGVHLLRSAIEDAPNAGRSRLSWSRPTWTSPSEKRCGRAGCPWRLSGRSPPDRRRPPMRT